MEMPAQHPTTLEEVVAHRAHEIAEDVLHEVVKEYFDHIRQLLDRMEREVIPAPPPPTAPSPLNEPVTITHAAQLAHVHPNTVRRAIKTGELQATAVPRGKRGPKTVMVISLEALTAWRGRRVR